MKIEMEKKIIEKGLKKEYVGKVVIRDPKDASKSSNGGDYRFWISYYRITHTSYGRTIALGYAKYYKKTIVLGYAKRYGTSAEFNYCESKGMFTDARYINKKVLSYMGDYIELQQELLKYDHEEGTSFYTSTEAILCGLLMSQQEFEKHVQKTLNIHEGSYTEDMEWINEMESVNA